MQFISKSILLVTMLFLFVTANISYLSDESKAKRNTVERVVIANGIIEQKIVIPFACGEYGDRICREYQWIVDGSAVVVSEKTYNQNTIGSHTTLTIKKDVEMTTMECLTEIYLFFCWLLIILSVLVLVARFIFWLLFRSDDTKLKDYF